MAPQIDPDQIQEQMTVQLNVRIPVWLRHELDRYMQYVDVTQTPLAERPRDTRKWPTRPQDIVAHALIAFLEDHPLKRRPGPPKDPAPPPIKQAKPKQRPTPKYQTRVP